MCKHPALSPLLLSLIRDAAVVIGDLNLLHVLRVHMLLHVTAMLRQILHTVVKERIDHHLHIVIAAVQRVGLFNGKPKASRRNAASKL